MTTDEIIDLAHKAGNPAITRYGLAVVTIKWMKSFAAFVAADEREACAQIADAEASIEGIAQRISAAIRARGSA